MLSHLAHFRTYLFFDCWLPSDDYIKLLSFGSVCTQACCQDARLLAKWSSEVSYKGVTKRPGLGKTHRVVGPKLLMEQGLKAQAKGVGVGEFPVLVG